MDAAPLDNLVDAEIVPSADSAATEDEYLARFPALLDAIEASSAIQRVMHAGPYDQDRIAACMRYVDQQQIINQHIYDLFVDINNVFAGKV